MLVVKIPLNYYKNRLPSDDLNLSYSRAELTGITHQRGSEIFVSALVETKDLYYPLTATDTFYALRKEGESLHGRVVSFDKTLVFKADKFLDYIKEAALLLPEDYQVLKENEAHIRKKFFDYVDGFTAHPQHEKYEHTTLRKFEEELGIHQEKLPNTIVPFYDVDTQEEYDYMVKNVDRTRISKADIHDFEQKKPERTMDSELQMEM